MKKAILTMKPVVLLALVLSLSLTSCKKGWWGYEEGNGGGTKGGGTKGGQHTNVFGTVYTQGCGISIYGDGIWIKLDDGTLLQPCSQSFQTLCPIILHEGDRVELSYSNYKGDYPDFQPYCDMMAFPFKRVTIDFINVVSNKTGECAPITLPNDYEEQAAAAVNILAAQVIGNSLKLHIGYSGCAVNSKRFAAIGVLNFSNDIPTYELKLTDSSPEMCQAYFTDDICFDLPSIRIPVSSKKIRIILNGYHKTFEF